MVVPTSLGGLPGHDRSQANAINNNGEVVGWSGVLNPDGALSSTGIVWRLDAAGNVVGTTAIDGALADINDSGEIVGDAGGHATIWQLDALGNVTGETDLGVLPGAASSCGEAINSAGQVAGASGPTNGEHAFLWSGGVMTDLGTLSRKGPRGSTPVSFSAGINDTGQVVGVSGATDIGALIEPKAFLWEAGERIDLDKSVHSFDFERAMDINNAGYIVGLGWAVQGDTPHGLLVKRN